MENQTTLDNGRPSRPVLCSLCTQPRSAAHEQSLRPRKDVFLLGNPKPQDSLILSMSTRSFACDTLLSDSQGDSIPPLPGCQQGSLQWECGVTRDPTDGAVGVIPCDTNAWKSQDYAIFPRWLQPQHCNKDAASYCPWCIVGFPLKWSSLN